MKDRTLTIPKLELQAAVLATCLKVSVLEQLKFRVNKTYFLGRLTNNVKIYQK